MHNLLESLKLQAQKEEKTIATFFDYTSFSHNAGGDINFIRTNQCLTF